MIFYTPFKLGLPPIINGLETRILSPHEKVSIECFEGIGVTLSKQFIWKKLDLFDLRSIFPDGRLIVAPQKEII